MKKYLTFLVILIFCDSAKSQSLFETVYELKQDPVGALSGKGNIVYFMHGSWLKIADISIEPFTVIDSILIDNPVKQFYVSTDRLYVLSTILSIYDITVSESPVYISTTILPDDCNWLTVREQKAYLATNSGILIGDLTNEKAITFSKVYEGKKLLWIDASDSLLVSQNGNKIYGFKFKVDENFVLVDSINGYGYDIPELVVYKNMLFIPSYNSGIFVFKISESNQFLKIDTLETNYSLQLFRSGDLLMSFERNIVGFGISVLDLKDWPDYKINGGMYQYEFMMNKFYAYNKYLTMTGGGSGILNYKNINDGYNLISHQFLSFDASEAEIYRNHLFLNSERGYRIYKYDHDFKFSLVKSYNEPFNDFGPFPDFHFEFCADTAYTNRAYRIEYFNLNDLTTSRITDWLNNPIGGMSITGNELWSFSEINTLSIGHGYNLKSPDFQKADPQKTFILNKSPLFIESDSKHIFITSYSDSLRIFSHEEKYDSSYYTNTQTIYTGGAPYGLLKYDSLLICQNNNKDFIILKEAIDGKFNIISNISIATNYNGSHFNVIDNYLVVPHKSRFYVYDIFDPVNPKFVESLPSYGSVPTSVGVDGNFLVLNNGSRGFSLLKYKGRPTSVFEPNNGSNTFSLHQNYPNPFNPVTVISYRLSAFSRVSLVVYDVLGREVQTLVSENQKAGDYRVHFDAKNLASGIYFATLTSKNGVKSIRMTVLK